MRFRNSSHRLQRPSHRVISTTASGAASGMRNGNESFHIAKHLDWHKATERKPSLLDVHRAPKRTTPASSDLVRILVDLFSHRALVRKFESSPVDQAAGDQYQRKGIQGHDDTGVREDPKKAGRRGTASCSRMPRLCCLPSQIASRTNGSSLGFPAGWIPRWPQYS